MLPSTLEAGTGTEQPTELGVVAAALLEEGNPHSLPHPAMAPGGEEQGRSAPRRSVCGGLDGKENT